MNHRRANSPVSHCPQCGGVVNAAIPVQHCSEAKHATSRRQQTAFCVDCGTQLIASR
jgi:rRNA maturation protein Nop10